MGCCYYFEVASCGKFFTCKVTNPATGAFKVIQTISSSESQDIHSEESINIVLSKRTKGKHQTHIEECRKTFLKNYNFDNLKRSLVRKMFSALITLYEHGHHDPYPVHSLECFNNTIYPTVFKKQR